MPTRFIFLCIFFLSALRVNAVALSGRVTSASGDPVSYGAGYVKGTTNGTTTNAEGNYTIDLPAGEYTLIFQAMGFAQKQITVDLTQGDKVVNVVMDPTSITLKEAVISDGEDPAYAVIRHAQKMRKFYL